MTSCSVSWPSSNSSVDVSAEATLFFGFSVKYLLFFEGEILVNGCLVFLEKSVEKITAQKGSSHDTDVGKLWEIVGQMGGYSRKIPNRYYEGWGLRLWNFQRGYSRNSISKFQGFIKKGVEFPGIKKNSCGICMGAWLLALDFGISKQQCNTILWNFQSWSFALSEISMGKVTISQGFFQIHNQE